MNKKILKNKSSVGTQTDFPMNKQQSGYVPYEIINGVPENQKREIIENQKLHVLNEKRTDISEEHICLCRIGFCYKQLLPRHMLSHVKDFHVMNLIEVWTYFIICNTLF